MAESCITDLDCGLALTVAADQFILEQAVCANPNWEDNEIPASTVLGEYPLGGIGTN